MGLAVGACVLLVGVCEGEGVVGAEVIELRVGLLLLGAGVAGVSEIGVAVGAPEGRRVVGGWPLGFVVAGLSEIGVAVGAPEGRRVVGCCEGTIPGLDGTRFDAVGDTIVPAVVGAVGETIVPAVVGAGVVGGLVGPAGRTGVGDFVPGTGMMRLVSLQSKHSTALSAIAYKLWVPITPSLQVSHCSRGRVAASISMLLSAERKRGEPEGPRSLPI